VLAVIESVSVAEASTVPLPLSASICTVALPAKLPGTKVCEFAPGPEMAEVAMAALLDNQLPSVVA